MTQLIEPESRRDGVSPGGPAQGPAQAPAQATESGPRLSGVVLDADLPAKAARGERTFVSEFVKHLAVQDYFLGAYWLLMLGAVSIGTGPGREGCTKKLLMDFGLFLTGLLLTRGGVLRRGSFANEMLYRVAIFLSIFLSYFQLREILPAVSMRSVDADLLAFDLRVFGVEPSLAWDRYVTPHTTEWFAFFYFGYFFVLSAHVFPLMLNGQSRFRIAHFCLGIMMLFCTGHLVYMLVPGWGPYRHLAGQFQHPLEGGLFWSLVKATVDAGGAQKDIFPSLHTAAPTFLAIYSYLHRRVMPFKYTWRLVAFAATQIIIATMFLRWHYLIDIFAGLTLATVSALLSHRIVRWETARRKRAGIAPTFTILEWPWTRAGARD